MIACATAAWGGEADLQALLDGVSVVDAPGIPGPVAPFGSDAFPVIVGRAGGVELPLVAATRFGAGRAVALSKNDFVRDPRTLEMVDTGRLLANAVRWAANNDDPRVGVHGYETVAETLREFGLRAEETDLTGLASFDVIVLNPDAAPAERIDELSSFVRHGGGLIAGFLGWGWLQLNPGKTLASDSLTNRLFAPMGIVWLDGTLGRTTDDGFAAGETPSPLTNASTALDMVLAREAGEAEMTPEQLAQAGAILSRTLDALPPEDTILRPRIAEATQGRRWQVVPTFDDPVTSGEVLDRLALTWDVREAMRASAEDVRPHPAAAAYPGAVPDDAPRVSRTIDVVCSGAGWISTGLYAAPGEAVRVTIPAEAANGTLGVRVGSSSDRLWHKSDWQRAPEVSRTWQLGAATTEVANAFGGLIYVTIPRDCAHGTVPVTIEGAVEAPFYVLGQTSLEDWRDRMRHLPAPRAELAGRKVILTLPSGNIRDLDDPEALMLLWDRVADLQAELAAYPTTDRDRPLRYCADVQISAGWMHAGYPMMVPLQTAGRLVDAENLRTEGEWGFWHEMGHMHQAREWTFEGTGEVTVNLFTLYVFEQLCGKDPSCSHESLTGDRRLEEVRQYFADGAPFERWKSKPFLALYMYLQLQQAFGWDAFRAVFAEYRDLPEDERPKTDDEERDQWLVRLSRQVGRNLGPFFEAWGVPTSDEARASIAGLPVWMPDDFPPDAAE